MKRILTLLLIAEFACPAAHGQGLVSQHGFSSRLSGNPTQAMPLQSPKSAEVLKLLFASKTNEAARLAATHLASLTDSFLASAPEIRQDYMNEFPFLQFTQVYQLSEGIVEKLEPAAAATVHEHIAYAAVCEMTGEEEKAMAAYMTALQMDARRADARRHLCFLLVKNGRMEQAKASLRGFSPDGLIPMGLRISEQIGMQQLFSKRLDLLELLSTYFELLDPGVYVAADWLPGLLDGYIGSAQHSEVRIIELYTTNNYSYSFDSPEQEENSKEATERRRELHDALCLAMMKLPQFAAEGFKRFAALKIKDGEEENAYIAMARELLELPPAPRKPEQQNSETAPSPRFFQESWVRFLTPIEFVLKAAADQGDFRELKEQLLPALNQAGKNESHSYLQSMMELLEGDASEFVPLAVKALETDYADIDSGNLVRQLFEIMEGRGIDTDPGPLLLAHFKNIAHAPYQSPGFVLEYAKERRGKGLESYQAFLEEVAQAMIGPKEGRAERIVGNYRPGVYNLKSPGNAIRNYMLFLGQMVRELQLAGPALAIAYELKLVHPNDYEFQNNFENAMSYSRIRTQQPKFHQFLRESPFLGGLDTFQSYPMQNVYRSSAFGYMLYSLGRMSTSDRNRFLAPIKSHKPDTFGKETILAFLEAGSGTSKQRLVLAGVMEKHMDAVSRMPEDRQQDLLVWFRAMQSSGSSLSSSVRNAAPKTSAWYAAMIKNGASNALNRGESFSPEVFLKFSSRAEFEQTGNLDYTARQLVSQLAATDLGQAEKVIRHYIVLASQPSLNAAAATEEFRRANFEMVLSQLVNLNPSFETLELALRLIQAAGDPGKGAYPNLENGVRMALRQNPFASLEEVSAPLLAATGNLNHSWLIPHFCERLAALDASALEALAAAPEGDLAGNAIAIDLSACARLFLVAQGKGDRESAEKVFIARIHDSNQSMPSRLQLIPSVGSLAIQGEAWQLANACLDLLEVAWGDKDSQVQLMAPASLLNALAGAEESAPQRGAAERLLGLWSRNTVQTPMVVDSLQQALTLAGKFDFPIDSLLTDLPENVQRQPGLLPLLVRQGAPPRPEVLAGSFLVMPPVSQPSGNRNRSRTVRIANGRQVVEQQPEQRPALNLGQDVYDATMHQKLQPFLGSIEDPGQRYFAEFLVAALPDGPGHPPATPARDERLAELAGRYDRDAFSSAFLAEHSLSWLAAAIGVTDEIRDDVAHFGRRLDYRLLNQWNDGYLKMSRLVILNHFFQDAATSDPEAFAEILDPVLEALLFGDHNARQFLESYCVGFPGNLLEDSASLTPEKAAAYLPILRKMSVASRSHYWSGRDQVINGNLVLHILANQMDAYKDWLKNLDDNTRINMEHSVDLSQTIALLTSSLNGGSVTKERRFQILNGLFAATSVSQNSSLSDASQVFNFMVEQKVISSEEVLEYGPAWAEADPRDGAAFGELARYQAEAGKNEEAILNYVQAVVHVPMDNQRLYTQFHMEKAKLLLEFGRTEAAMNWFEFAQPGRIYSSQKDAFEELRRSVRVRYLTEPSRSKATMSTLRQSIDANPADQETWKKWAEVLSAHGSRSLEAGDPNLGANLLKLSYYIQLQMRKTSPEPESTLLNATKQDLTQALSALGQGGEKRSFVRRNSGWNYFYQEGGWGSTSWRRSNSVSGQWKSGLAPLGYGDGDETTTLDFGSDKENKPITAYFRATFEVEDVSQFDQLSLGVLHDDGMVAYLNGEEIARNNMPAGTVQPQTLAPGSRGSPEENEFWQAVVPAGYLKPGTNIIAVEVHQNNADSSDLGFDLELSSDALNTTKIVQEIEDGAVIEALGEWRQRLPANVVPMAKALALAGAELPKTDASRK